MKKITLSIVTAIAMAVLLLSMTPNNSTAQDNADRELRHVVAFKFKEGVSEVQIKEVVDAFVALKTSIPIIKSLEWGTNNSPEGLNKGTTHGFILTFTSEKDRDDYLVHPEHKKFVELLMPHMDDAFVIDFWANK